MGIISQISFTENVAIVTFENAKAGIKFISNLFDIVAKAGINIDMISQSSPKGDHNNVSFTLSDEKVTDILAITTKLNQEKKCLMPLISSGNVKISLYGKDMPNYSGVAAGVFNHLYKNNIDIMLITTSDVDISIVVSQANADKAYKVLKDAYLSK